jgi:hypothetical protein
MNLRNILFFWILTCVLSCIGARQYWNNSLQGFLVPLTRVVIGSCLIGCIIFTTRYNLQRTPALALGIAQSAVWALVGLGGLYIFTAVGRHWGDPHWNSPVH